LLNFTEMEGVVLYDFCEKILPVADESLYGSFWSKKWGMLYFVSIPRIELVVLSSVLRYGFDAIAADPG